MRSKPSSCSSSVEEQVIKDGRVSGVVPESEAFAVHYPGYPSSVARAVETLGGLAEMARVRERERGSNLLELRFRPEDPFCHPVFGELRPATALLLRISSNNAASASASIVTRVNHAYHFQGMADYQHVLPLHAAKAKAKATPTTNNRPSSALPDTSTITADMDAPHVMMLLPPLFSNKNIPENIVLKPASTVVSKIMQRGLVIDRWEMDIEPSLALSYKTPEVPGKVNWEQKISRGTTEWGLQEAVCKLFDEKPIWTRRSIHEQLLDSGFDVSENMLKRLLFRAGYYFSTGPFGKFWIKRGYDPRKDTEALIYQRIDFRMPPELRNLPDMDPDLRSKKQRWKDVCNFLQVPFKVFVYLQLSELQDSFIQDEICKPSYQTSCSHATGWFSQPMLKCLRLQVGIRFLSLFPVGPARDLLKSAKSQLERSKKEEAIWRSQNRQVNDHTISNTDADGSTKTASTQSGQEEEEREEEEEDEEEEHEDGGFHADDNSYQMEGLPNNNYLREILRGFSFEQGSSSGVADSGPHVDLSDGEYQILEQSSDDNDDF
ncbi:hypothetical protein LUZ62_087254 [Rhynchospora pubera]|uniref:General transcription factor 3C polypeptide 5 n=1 Tax=Rhynchospora pubera TaxID=906938 RepID=A0AAV8CAT7_9POAL|nr:hypothetical protein LUZ62_087254 [Rhynchospora pubera]